MDADKNPSLVVRLCRIEFNFDDSKWWCSARSLLVTHNRFSRREKQPKVHKQHPAREIANQNLKKCSIIRARIEYDSGSPIPILLKRLRTRIGYNLDSKRMVSGFLGKEVPVFRLRVRISCYPLDGI